MCDRCAKYVSKISGEKCEMCSIDFRNTQYLQHAHWLMILSNYSMHEGIYMLWDQPVQPSIEDISLTMGAFFCPICVRCRGSTVNL